MSGDIWPHNGCLKISLSRHVKLEAWDALMQMETFAKIVC